MPVNGSVAPVCPISRSQAIPPQSPKTIPGLTRVNDLPSVINNLNLIINYLNAGPDDFKEKVRVTDVVRVYNPNDREQWVDVERISFLRLDDPTTGGHVTFEY